MEEVNQDGCQNNYSNPPLRLCGQGSSISIIMVNIIITMYMYETKQ